MSIPTPVVRATSADTATLAGLVAVAFAPIPLTRWLVPHPGDREQIMPRYVRLLLDHATAVGWVDTIRDRSAVAVWAPAGIPGLPPVPDYSQRLAASCGRYIRRFQALDAAMHAAHPNAPAHEHLLFLAVHPGAQGRGLGSMLLRAHHTHLDTQARPSYLEATNPPAVALYHRHGYTILGDGFQPAPDCPGRMVPMWRQPHQGHRVDGIDG